MFNSCNSGCGDWGSGIWGCLLSLIILIVVLEFLGGIIGCNSIGSACSGNVGCGNNNNCNNYCNPCC